MNAMTPRCTPNWSPGSKLEADLRRALEAGELFLHDQPTFDLGSGQIVGPRPWPAGATQPGALVPPTEFIPWPRPAASSAPGGLGPPRSLPPGRRLAAGQLPAGQAADPQHQPVRPPAPVPRGGRRRGQGPVRQRPATGLAGPGDDRERPARRQPDRARHLASAHGPGARLAIDDFGTGYSSLSYLHRFPVDILKIDRSFGERLSHASDNAEPARTIVRLGQSLQLVTVAEGVEDSTQFLALRRMGCDVGQGYYFGRPMESEAIGRLLRDDLPAPARAAAAG